ncbi:MAG: 2'-5' RNA ligase family protein [Propionibacteriaceae bacterium]|nr:2'-5' RNA ligase family protein [Propionibacteriaceae bacterium]
MSEPHRPGHGVLLVGVPPLEEWVRARTAHYDASFVSADPAFAHAHVTVLAPFPGEGPGIAARVAAVAAAVEPFAYTLERVETFPDGVVHLVPEPDDGFRALTAAARAVAPEVDPYWGRFDPVPHLTLDRLGSGVTEQSTRDAVAHLLPARATASALLWTWWESGACRVLGRFPLGAAPRD